LQVLHRLKDCSAKYTMTGCCSWRF